MSISILDQGNSFGILTTTSSTGVITAFVFDATGLGNIGIGTTIFTGTTNQTLQVGSGAYIAGSLGVGITNPATALHLGSGGNIRLNRTDNSRSSIIFHDNNGLNINANTTGDDVILNAGNVSGKVSLQNNSVPTLIAQSGTVLIGTGTSIGTAGLELQVGSPSATGNAYISGLLGIGNTIPTSALDVAGNVRISGVITASSFSGNISGVTGISTFALGSTVLIGTGDSTGTANQALQVGSATTQLGAYVSGLVGIAHTLPTVQLDVIGNTRVSGVSTAARFSATTGISSFASGTTVIIGSGTSIGTAGHALQVVGAAGSNVHIGGLLGVAHTLPTVQLDVNGNTKVSGVSTAARFSATTGISSFASGTTVIIGSGTSTGTAGQAFQVVGAAGSNAHIGGLLGIAHTLPTVQLDVNGNTKVSGVSTAARFSATTGISSFASGTTVLIGTGTSTGTANQTLQVVGGASFTGTGSSVGIGTTLPITPLHISDSGGAVNSALYTSESVTVTGQNTAPGVSIIVAGSSDTHRGVFKGTRARGTLSSPTVPLLDDNTFSLLGAIYDGSTGRATAAVNMEVDGDVGVGTAPQRITFWTGTAVSRIERARIQSTGEVTIATTSVTGTASQPLQVSGGAYVSGNLGVGVTNPTSALSVGGTITELYGGTYWNLVSQYDVGIGASQVPLNQFFGELAYMDSYSPSGLRRTGGGTDDLVVNSDGLIGIGSTNPGSKLTVNGDVYIAGVITAVSGFVNLSNLGIGSTAPSVQLEVLGNSKISGIVTVGGLQVGIGSTASDAAPAGLLQVGIGSTSVVITGLGSVGVGTLRPSQLFQVGTVGPLGFSTDNRVFVVTSAGNAGIGTQNPATKLHVIGGAIVTGGMTVAAIAATTGTSLFLPGTTLLVGSASSVGTANMAFQVGTSTTQFNSYFSGLVGIGSTQPTSKLDVIGDAEISGMTTSARFNATTGISSFLSGTTVIVGGASSTGTPNQSVQIAGAAGSSVYIGGSVGLGTTNPGAKLTVAGTGSLLNISAVAVPTNDLVSITNIGFPATTAGVNNLQIDYFGGAAAVEAGAVRVGMTPGTTTGGIWNSFRILATSASGSGVVHNAVKCDSITPGVGTDNALYVGSGWDNIINLNETSIINGVGEFRYRVNSPSGVSTFASGTTVLIGTGNSTGTINQGFQVTGGAHFTGAVGVGTTLPDAALSVNGNMLVVNARSVVGYNTGTGSAVAQATGKTTAVTLNAPSGQITLALGQMTTGIVSTFTLTNSVIAANDVLILNHVSGGTAGAYTLNAQPAAGSAQINVRNATAGTLNEQPIIRFVVIRGAIA